MRTKSNKNTEYSSDTKKKKIGLTLIGINVICEVPFYFVCNCRKFYIIGVQQRKNNNEKKIT